MRIEKLGFISTLRRHVYVINTWQEQRRNENSVWFTDQRASGCSIWWQDVLSDRTTVRNREKMGVWLCIWASRCPLTADHWRLDSVAVLAHTGASDANQPECMEKNRYICVCVVRCTETSVVISECIVLGVKPYISKVWILSNNQSIEPLPAHYSIDWRVWKG